MHAHKALKALVFTFILTLGAFLPALLIPPVHAAETQGQTTLYFTDALNFLDNENSTGFGFASMSQTPPTNQENSEYPPALIIKNTTKLLPRFSFNINETLTWLVTAWVIKYLQNDSGFNLSDLFGFFGNDTFNGFDIGLLFPNPYRVVEEYTYNGNDTININGDLSYNLYFTPPNNNRPKFRDTVKVALYSMNINSLVPLPKIIANTTITLAPKDSNIYKQLITLKNVQHTLVPGDSLLFSVEIIPSNKTIPNLITKIIDVNRFIARLEKRADFLEKRKLPTLQNISATIKSIISALNDTGINISSADIAALFNAELSTKFTYNSIDNPASVTIPAKISEQDIRDYFLQPNQVMSETRPEGKNISRTELSTIPTLWKINQPLDRNRILKLSDVTAELYFYRAIILLPGKVTVTATLYDDNTTIASSETILTRQDVQTYLLKAITPIHFSFTGEDREISYDHQLGLGISLGNGTNKVRTPLNVQYDSVDCSSFLRVRFEETQNIKIHDVTATPADGKIIPGGSVQYILNITSKKADAIQISTITKEMNGSWEISAPSAITIAADSWTKIPLYINSTNNTKEAYDSIIDLIAVVTGNTGIARYAVSAEISRDAIQYNVEILGYSSTINISKGENRTFYFTIKNNNTGAIDDTDNYIVTATSKNNWPLIPRENIRNVKKGETTEPTTARVTIQAPKNTNASSDTITITVTSENDPTAKATITITVKVNGGDFLEELYNFFDSTAKSLGLNDLFGSYGAIVLVSIIMVIILFILIILALVLTIKSVRLICTERIKEIEASDKATYELTIQNPTKKQQTYEIYAEHSAPREKWVISIEPLSVTIDGRLTHTIKITAAPTEDAQSGDWTQITVRVKKTGKTKTENLILMAMIKEGKSLLQLGSVSHWPTEFNPGEKIITSFSVSNNGTVSARNVNVFFYLNGKQKNKLTVTIPAGSSADIQIPWIAIKGKNQVRIRLKEQ